MNRDSLKIKSWFWMGVVLFFSRDMGMAVAQTQITFPSSATSSPKDSSGISARATAMGSAFVGVADDASALFWNPAGLGGLQQGEAAAHYDSWLGNTGMETAELFLPLEGLGGIGIAGSFTDFGTFEQRDSFGALTGSYGVNHLGLKLGWGRDLTDNFAMGFSVAGSQVTAVNLSERQLTFDGGLLFKVGKGFKIGLEYANFGWTSGVGNTASTFRAGLSYGFPDLDKNFSVLASVSGNLETGGQNRLEAGAEEIFYSFFFVREGYQANLFNNQVGGFQGLTLGCGFRLKDLNFDYAFLPYGDLGASHQASLSYRFDVDSGAEREKRSLAQVRPVPQAIQGEDRANSSAPPAPIPIGQESNPTSGKNDLTIEFKLPSGTAEEVKKLEAQGKAQEAIQLYTAAIEKNNQDVLAWYGLGTVYFRTGQKEYAVQCFEQVLRLEPENRKLVEWLQKYKKQSP